MAFEFKRLADVEALSEVPENATVLAEVNGAIKRIPSVGLGGGSGNTIVIVKNPNFAAPKSIDTTSSDEFLVNMNFEDAMDAYKAFEITGAVYYSTERTDSDWMLQYADIYLYSADCLQFNTQISGFSIYWTADGLSTFSPDGGSSSPV